MSARDRSGRVSSSPAASAFLLPYAGLMTLLFALFAALYALSMQDAAKAKSTIAAIRRSFGGGGTSGAGGPSQAPSPSAELTLVREQLAELAGGLPERGVIEAFEDRRGIVVRITGQDFFAPGEAGAGPDFLPALDRVGSVVAKIARAVRIEGHTDPAEMSSRGYPSDWELSSARAAWVARRWIERFGVDPSRLQVLGYSHHRPASEATTEWGQGKNRRIEVVILSQ